LPTGPLLWEKYVRTIGGWLGKVSDVFQNHPTAPPRPAQKTDLRTLPFLWEGGVRTIKGWLDEVTGVSQR
jgi:hypothetical protein